MKFTIRDENGRPLYTGHLPDEWVRPDTPFDVRLDEYKSNPEVYTPFFRLVMEPDNA